ncbi:Uncharacterised protein [Candidatus Norongarragalina meridionalis]|nr:Uncharacterised protein [Candidatus Norongarragalina meridionalis]
MAVFGGKAFLAVACLLLSLAVCVSADGGIVPDYHYRYARILAPEQKAAIFWDGNVERMILSTKITSDNLTSVAWLVPIQSSSAPDVQPADNGIFFDLADLFARNRVYDRIPNFAVGAAAQPGGVEVVKIRQVDIYNLTILRATDADALIGWLNDNGFSFPENRKDVLDYYVRGDYYFVANRINLLAKYPNATVGERERTCADGISIYPDYYGMDAERMKTEISSQIQDQFNQSDDCKNANFEAVTALVELRNGVATPLQFTFKPDKPFYPMEISSINYGDTLADVYVFGTQCFDDSSQLLAFRYASQNAWIPQKYGFASGGCVSMLQYAGPNSELKRDSFFVEKPYDPKYDVDYSPPYDVYGEAPGVLFVLLLFLAIAVVPALVVGVLTAHYAEKNKKRSRMIHKIGFALIAFAVALPGVLALMFVQFSAELLFGAVLITLLYGLFPVGGFLSGYFAVKKKKWWIAPVGVAAAAALLAAVYLLLLLSYQ